MGVAATTAGANGEEVEQSLYEVRRKIYPRAVTGWFAGWRWGLVWLTQLVFYGLPWLVWNDRQAVLFDLGARKFYIFGLVLWPQDFIYLTALLIIAAYSLFLFTAIGGRLWCGYACPQTVYTEMFMWVERKVEGNRAARMRLDQAAMGGRKLALKALKHAIWIAIALWTGFTFVGYFTPIRDLLQQVATVQLGPWQSFWILFYGFATYGNAGWMREQVCKYMCPYARFQSAMFDKDTMIVTYDPARGEPRGPRARKADARALGLGDCVDCTMCVQVCPTGIDIRNGLQYECIGCAACIDACDQVMGRMGYPKGLIRYATENAIKNRWDTRQMFQRVLRPRTAIYTAILGLIVAVAGVSLYNRVPLKADLVPDRAAIGRKVDGELENVYRLQVMNTMEQAHRYRITVSGLPGLRLDGDAEVEMAPATTRQVPIRLRVPVAQAPTKGSHRIEVQLEAVDDPSLKVNEKTVFLVR
ncbi:MAG: cytochrome c oxidase accessory protein CcoG [Burkholderiales bacterium]|nr:cytochrome c oxidase accessory protein CcoG [Burkholderiales bacterium]